MILCLRCDCGGSENLIRRALQAGGDPEWLSRPMAVGKKASLDLLENPQLPQDDIEVRSLKRFISEASSFAVVLGVKGEKIKWANVSDGAIGKLDAEVIVSHLA